MPANDEVDLKLYLKADVGFGITVYAHTLERRFSLLGVQPYFQSIEHLVANAMDRTLLVRVHKGLNKQNEYAVELIDPSTGFNHNDHIIRENL